MWLGIPAVVVAQAGSGSLVDSVPSVSAITFAEQPNEVFLPLRETAAALKWTVQWDDANAVVILKDKPLSSESVFRNPSRLAFIRLTSLVALGAQAGAVEDDKALLVSDGEEQVSVVIPEQRVEICLTEQKLVAYQGPHLVLTTNISSGRRGFGTPPGQYKAQGKQRHRVSRTYNNAPMPYSVHLFGGYFIHGAASVPRTPASHGCIRMPLVRGNPARGFFSWVEVGTPIHIRRGWSEEVASLLEPQVSEEATSPKQT